MGFIKTFDGGSAPRSEASLESGEGTRSRPESGRLRAARPVAIGVGSDYPNNRFRWEHEWRVREGLV